MKKIYYLFALAVLGFSACQKESPEKKTLKLTLQANDYAELPSSNYASTAHSFKTSTDAQTGIATILNDEYSHLADGSTAAVTYAQSAGLFKVADSVIANDSYTLSAADYLLLPGNKYADFTVAQLLQWLPYKFPSIPNNSLKLITWTIYPASTSQVMPFRFLYTNNKWIAIYTIQPSQYTAVGLGKYD